MKPSFFLLGPPCLALAPDLELAVLGLRSGFFLESLPFDTLGPCPWLAWSRLPLAKYFQSSTSRLATCAAPKSWTFWRGLEPLHEIEEPVLFRHTKKAQGELRKMAFTYSRMGPVCWLINMADHNRAGKPSILPETCPQHKMNLIALHAPTSLRLFVRLTSPSFSREATARSKSLPSVV